MTEQTYLPSVLWAIVRDYASLAQRERLAELAADHLPGLVVLSFDFGSPSGQSLCVSIEKWYRQRFRVHVQRYGFMTMRDDLIHYLSSIDVLWEAIDNRSVSRWFADRNCTRVEDIFCPGQWIEDKMLRALTVARDRS